MKGMMHDRFCTEACSKCGDDPCSCSDDEEEGEYNEDKDPYSGQFLDVGTVYIGYVYVGGSAYDSTSGGSCQTLQSSGVLTIWHR